MKRKIWFVVLILVAAAIGGWWLWPVEQPVEIQAVERPTRVEKTTLRSTLFVDGSIQAGSREELRARSAGVVDEIFVEEGQRVEVGDLLFTLVSDDAQRQWDKAKRDLVSALNDLREAEVGVMLKEIEVPLQIEQARLRLTEAEQALEAAKNQTITAEQRSELELEVERARVVYHRASGLDALVQAQGKVADAEASLLAAEDALEDRKIRSPIGGIAISVGVGRFENITNSTVLAVIADYSIVEVVTNIDEYDMRVVAPGQTVHIQADAYPNQQFEGVVTRIAEEADRGNIVTFRTLIRAENPGEILRPGMTVEAEIVVAERVDALVIPVQAVHRNPGGSAFVMVRTEEGDEQRPVTIGMQTATLAEVITGLEVDERVLVQEFTVATATPVIKTPESVTGTAAPPSGFPASLPTAPTGSMGQGGQGRAR